MGNKAKDDAARGSEARKALHEERDTESESNIERLRQEIERLRRDEE